MRIVVALGGNALLKRGEPMTHDVQRANIQDAHLAYPPLTTVHLHKRLMGRLAAEQLHRCIECPDDPPLTVLTPTSLVVRSSCGA